MRNLVLEQKKCLLAGTAESLCSLYSLFSVDQSWEMRSNWRGAIQVERRWLSLVTFSLSQYLIPCQSFQFTIENSFSVQIFCCHEFCELSIWFEIYKQLTPNGKIKKRRRFGLGSSFRNVKWGPKRNRIKIEYYLLVISSNLQGVSLLFDHGSSMSLKDAGTRLVSRCENSFAN